MSVRVLGCGHADPSVRIDNAEIEADLGLEPGWIERRTGVTARRVCGPDESCSTLAVTAGTMALRHARVEARDVGLVLLATSTPDRLLPPTAPIVATRLGCDGAGGIDLAGACAGFVYALVLADGWVRGTGQTALVVAANVLSRRMDPADRGSRAIFADGAGAVVLGPSDQEGVLGHFLASDGRHSEAIRVVAGGSLRPMDADAIAEGLHYLRIEDTTTVFAEAVRGMTRAGEHAMENSHLTADDIALWIPHQANLRIIDKVGDRLAIPRDRWVITLPERGNSSAASLPTALSCAVHDGRAHEGDRLLLTAVGAGTVEAGVVLQW